jgi:hypothetical protein
MLQFEWKYYAKSKADTKEQILYDPIYMKCPNKQI